MLQILDLAEKISDVSATVLVTGEPGTGKKRLIKYITRKSTNYDNKPFVHIPTYLLAGDDFESELLGIEDRQASRGRSIYIEIANVGTMLARNTLSISKAFSFQPHLAIQPCQLRPAAHVPFNCLRHLPLCISI